MKRKVLNCSQNQPLDYKPTRLTSCGCKKDTMEIMVAIDLLFLQMLLPIMQHVAMVLPKWMCMNYKCYNWFIQIVFYGIIKRILGNPLLLTQSFMIGKTSP